MGKTQEEFVKNQLLKKGKVSRNQCLNRYISRLGARILDLKRQGFCIVGKFEKTKNGQDYVYFLIK